MEINVKLCVLNLTSGANFNITLLKFGVTMYNLCYYDLFGHKFNYFSQRP